MTIENVLKYGTIGLLGVVIGMGIKEYTKAPDKVYLEDLNADGYQDIVVETNSGLHHNYVFLGDNAGFYPLGKRKKASHGINEAVYNQKSSEIEAEFELIEEKVDRLVEE